MAEGTALQADHGDEQLGMDICIGDLIYISLLEVANALSPKMRTMSLTLTERKRTLPFTLNLFEYSLHSPFAIAESLN
jgi:hypothetical protein